jgi:hypothetical protein
MINQIAEIIARAREAGDHDLVQSLVCRECHYDWRVDHDLEARLRAGSPRMQKLADWLGKPRLMRLNCDRILDANSHALAGVYGIPARHLMRDHAPILFNGKAEQEVMRRSLPASNRKRGFRLSRDCDGNVLVERTHGSIPRPGELMVVRELVDVLPAEKFSALKEVLDAKGFHHPFGTVLPCRICRASPADRRLRMCSAGGSSRHAG